MENVKDVNKVNEMKEINPTNYDELVSKLVDLCGINKIFEEHVELCYIDNKLSKSYRKTRSEVSDLLETEHSEILDIFRLLFSSGMIHIYHGNIYDHEHVEFEFKSTNYLDNGFIDLHLGDIKSSSLKVPSSLLKWFSNRFELTPLERYKDMMDKTEFEQQDKTN